MRTLRDVIPEKFYKGDIAKPSADTVGELISILNKLPKDLPIKQGFSDGCSVTVFNINSDAHVGFDESEDE